jgi:DNA-binding response OmpR family regulator
MNSGLKKVLIVDDSEIILNSLKRYLEDYNFRVYTSQDGLDGIKITAEKRPDIIFLDLMMPNFDGIKMLQVKNVLSDIKNIPVVVISGNTMHSNVMAAMEAGAIKVISKPIDNNEVKKIINEILDGDYFSEPSKSFVSFSKQKEIEEGLLKIFLEKFPEQKHRIAAALRKRDAETMKDVIHEIKGAGTTIGHPEITSMAKEIMKREFIQPADWVFAEIKTSQIFRVIEELKRQLRKTVK